MITVIVTLLSININNTNHVGNDWSFEAYVNGNAIRERQALEIPLEQGKLFFHLKAEEYDKSSPDIGVVKEALDYHRLLNEDGTPITKTFVVKVEEDKGRYSGNKATITFNFKIKEVIKVQ